jgi:hypothetical protein
MSEYHRFDLVRTPNGIGRVEFFHKDGIEVWISKKDWHGDVPAGFSEKSPVYYGIFKPEELEHV